MALPSGTRIGAYEVLAKLGEGGMGDHRGPKPANVKLRPDGTVKVLDFGLAKAAVASVSWNQAALGGS